MKNWYLYFKNIYQRIVPKYLRRIIWRIWHKVFKGIYFFTLETRREFAEYYRSGEVLPAGYPKTVVYMADGRAFSGGLADRLRGIVSTYKLCKELNIAFKIHFTSPFFLKDFLLSAGYDWHISPGEICYNWKQARPCFIYTGNNSMERQAFWARHFFRERYKQVHVYTNMVIADKEYGGLFRELFRPTPDLETLVDYHRGQIKVMDGGGGHMYISVAFRFLQLLGDFTEPDSNFSVLPDNERDALIHKCIGHLKEIYRENDYAKVLVTSDSITFLEEARKLPFVYVIPGEISHTGYRQNINKNAVLKVFLDYFMLSYSQKIYLVVEEQMYQSGFSRRAALHGNIPFIIKRYDQ
jgi:hypothetical protein